LLSCAGENNVIIPVPPREYFIQEKKIIELDNITETMTARPSKVYRIG
jgi:hypothetical protein